MKQAESDRSLPIWFGEYLNVSDGVLRSRAPASRRDRTSRGLDLRLHCAYRRRIQRLARTGSRRSISEQSHNRTLMSQNERSAELWIFCSPG